jgi:tetratricopeptide (TPR) repeat protein
MTWPGPRGFALILAAGAALFGPTPAAPAAPGEKYALLIGVSQYDPTELTSLPYAEADVTELARVLVQDCGYRPDHVVLMTQAEAGKKGLRFAPEAEKVRRELDTFLRLCEEGDSLLVALAGHGVQFVGDAECYFCPADAKLEDKAKLIGLRKEVYAELEKCKAGFKLLLVDACRNDPRTSVSRDANPKVKIVSFTRPRTPTPGGTAAFFSCSEGQKAYESPDLKHGVFFHYVIEAYKGAAADTTGQVTLPDLEKYVKREVKAFVHDKFQQLQMPEIVSQVRDLVPLARFAWRSALRRADELFAQKQYAEAITAYTEVLRDNPGLVAARARRGEGHAWKGDYAEAIRDYTDVLQAEPNNTVVRADRGWVYLQLGDYPKAIADCTETLRIDPKRAAAYTYRGRAYYNTGEYEKALADHSEVTRLAPDDALGHRYRADDLWYLGRPREAIASYDEAIRLNPQDMKAYQGRGWTYNDLGEYDKALPDLNEAVRLAPDNAENVFQRARAYAGKKDYAKALADYTRATELAPNLARGHAERAWALNSLGEYDAAIAACNKALAIDPNLASAYRHRADANGFKALNANDDRTLYLAAIKDYNRALELAASYPEAIAGRGWTYNRLGKSDQAVRDCTRAIELSPNYADAYRWRAQAYRSLGRTAEADADDQKVKELSGK